MNVKNDFCEMLLKVIENVSQNQILSLIEMPPEVSQGDYSYPVFSLSKIYKKNPQEIAKDITTKLNKISQEKYDFSCISGYVNLKIKDNYLFKKLISEVLTKDKEFGSLTKDSSKTFVIDTFNVNPLKTLHVGHLRNIVTGESINRLLKKIGQNPKPVFYSGDVGTHIAKWYWYYKKQNLSLENVPKENKSKWFGEIYLSAIKKEKEDEKYTEEINNLQKKILTDNNLKEEIKKLRNISVQSYFEVAKELQVYLDDYLFESQSEKKFLEIQENLKNKYSKIIYENENALIADLKEKKLDVLVLVKQNGAPLYGAKDIGLVLLKQEKYPLANDFLYVVGSEQTHYFKQLIELFKTIYPNTQHKHIAHGTVNLGSEKMASREGALVLYEDFRDLLFKKVLEKLKENNLETEKQIVKDIAFGTIKFEMLKLSLNKTLDFSLEDALDLQGDSSVYVQYSGVRAQSILRKVNEAVSLEDVNKITDVELTTEEKTLLSLINNFKEKVIFAAEEYKPHVIANHCLLLARAFNRFYGSCVVLSEDKKQQTKRLLITKAYLITLKNALDLLGINVPNKM
jgi:arginyl-tRNA synthetase